MHKLPLLALAFLAAAGAAPHAQAATQIRHEMKMAAADCQAALPVFEGLIRKRPQGVFNEGTSPSYITCGFGGHGSRVTNAFTVGLINNTGEWATINCTLVHTWSSFPAQYVAKTFRMNPDTEAGGSWHASLVNNNTPFARAAVSCLLPPGTGITYLRNEYVEDIGN